ncbi:MAG: copper resistance protein CopC [Anaerolineae bacterium]
MKIRYSLLITLLILLAKAMPAFAHANLLQANPEANAALERAPAQIELFFSEPIENGFSTIQVLNTSGKRVDNDDALVDPANPTRLTVSLRSLPAGIYTVSWRTLSSVDSHVTAGAYPFAVGEVDEAALAAASQGGQQTDLSPGEVFSRWLTYLAVMALAGSAMFILLVWQPALAVAALEAHVRPSWRQLTAVSLLLLLLANIFWLLVQAGQVSGTLFAFPWQESVTKVLFMTRFGAQWSGRLTLAILMAWLLARPPSRRTRWLALLLGLLMLLTLSLGSHAAAKPAPLLPALSDWVHLTAASVWVGGLFHFLAGLAALRAVGETARARVTAVLIPRFSALAATSVSLLVLTGVYGSLVQVGSWEALTGTVYGRALLVKLLIFLPMLALGGVNLLVTRPQMQRAAAAGNEKAVPRFRRLLAGEVILGVAVLLSVSILTALPVPEDPAAVPALRDTASADDLDIEMEVSPGKVGLNTFRVIVHADGRPLENAREVDLLFTPTTADFPPSETALSAQGSGVYAIQGGYISMPDAWQVQVAVRREDQFDSFANFYFNVGVNGSSPSIRWHRLTGLLVLAAGLGMLFALPPLLRSPRARKKNDRLPAAALILIGAFVFFRPPIVDGNTIPPNPIPPNADSIAAGEGLYRINCIPCHGVTGAGDGPVGRTLNPPPANLTIHTAPGVHPDGRLYNWVTAGVPGSVMPAFGKTLTDEERWHIVNYIRTLNQPIVNGS